MKIFDCIIYLDEDLLLDLRLNILNNYVDYFVIVESDKTWQNKNKIFNYNI
jgi:beta-1,4-mannosyl-glycoprotein beta-1,4-N-acetylglucosaminyltransferase